MKNHDLTIMTQDAVIWQYNICCPNCCPAQIFISVLWKSQYIRLSYGLWYSIFTSVIVKNYWELISKNKVSLLQTFISKVTFNLFLQFRKSLPSHGEQWRRPWTPIQMAYFCGSVKSIMFFMCRGSHEESQKIDEKIYHSRCCIWFAYCL